MKNTTHIMNARIWKKAAGGPYKKQKARNTLRTFYRQCPFRGFTEERLTESSYPTCLRQSQDLSLGVQGCRCTLQGLLLPFVAPPELQFLLEVVDSVAVRFLR